MSKISFMYFGEHRVQYSSRRADHTFPCPSHVGRTMGVLYLCTSCLEEVVLYLSVFNIYGLDSEVFCGSYKNWIHDQTYTVWLRLWSIWICAVHLWMLRITCPLSTQCGLPLWWDMRTALSIFLTGHSILWFFAWQCSRGRTHPTRHL